MSRDKILSRDALASALAGARQDASSNVVFTNGCFDVLHVGHVRLLERARALGDVLVVGLNSDRSVRALKGPGRPLFGEDDRAEVLAALSCVSWVTIFDEDTPLETLRVVRPDVHVKGGDYTPDALPEAPLLRELGARIEIFPLVAGRSTTSVIEKARERG